MKTDILWPAVAAAVMLACSSPKPAPSTDSSEIPVASVLPASVDTGHAAVVAECPHDGKWALCSVERRLKQAGFVVKRLEGDTARRAGFSVTPAVYSLGKSRLEVFLYRDTASRAGEVAKLDTLTVGPIGKSGQWGDLSPTLIRSANMAAVFLSQNARQTERVMLALTAGPPQPGSPR